MAFHGSSYFVTQVRDIPLWIGCAVVTLFFIWNAPWIFFGVITMAALAYFFPDLKNISKKASIEKENYYGYGVQGKR